MSFEEYNAQIIYDYVLGTCRTNYEIANHFGWNESDVKDSLLDYELERCDDCGWWHDSCELVGYCEACGDEEIEWEGCCPQCVKYNKCQCTTTYYDLER